MEASIRRMVRAIAPGRCEYCRLPQAAQPFVAFHVEHIVAKQHGGSDHPDNLCIACERCNAFKGPNLTGVDPAGRDVERLYDPRRQLWEEHFVLRGAAIEGLSADRKDDRSGPRHERGPEDSAQGRPSPVATTERPEPGGRG